MVVEIREMAIFLHQIFSFLNILQILFNGPLKRPLIQFLCNFFAKSVCQNVTIIDNCDLPSAENIFYLLRLVLCKQKYNSTRCPLVSGTQTAEPASSPHKQQQGGISTLYKDGGGSHLFSGKSEQESSIEHQGYTNKHFLRKFCICIQFSMLLCVYMKISYEWNPQLHSKTREPPPKIDKIALKIDMQI